MKESLGRETRDSFLLIGLLALTLTAYLGLGMLAVWALA